MHRKSTLGINRTVDLSPNILNPVRDGRSALSHVTEIRQVISYIVFNGIGSIIIIATTNLFAIVLHFFESAVDRKSVV